jgi:XTP/dITP diphosphohydrolase
MELIFATNNKNKIREIKAVLNHAFQLITLAEAGIDKELEEPHFTLEANALEKAKTVQVLTGKSCFSEDTGLEVASLANEPGVFSARYAGPERNDVANMNLLLTKLKGSRDRSARFRTIICLLLEGETHYFEGICNGRIAEARSGSDGFGYDPVFIPDGASETFAEMGMEEKSRFSHRKKALGELVTFLNQFELKRNIE